MRLLMLGMTLMLCGQAEAASLKVMTTLHGPNVYLRDLFDDAGSNADRVLGPGPDPGGRIVVGAAQLNAIARQFGVAWRTESQVDRAVLEWPGRSLRKEDVMEPLRAAIMAAGGSDNIDIELPGFVPAMVPADVTVAPVVSQLDYDPGSGRFTAVLTVSAEGMHPIDTRVSGQATEMVDAPVGTTRLLADTVLRPEDVHIGRVRSSLVQNDVARSLDQVVGMMPRRSLAAGQPLRLADLVRPPMVRRGATVRVELIVSGLNITGQAMALDTGAEGERIRIQNMSSHAYLFAQVTGPGQVRVVPDAGAAVSMLPARNDGGSNP